MYRSFKKIIIIYLESCFCFNKCVSLSLYTVDSEKHFISRIIKSILYIIILYTLYKKNMVCVFDNTNTG